MDGIVNFTLLFLEAELLLTENWSKSVIVGFQKEFIRFEQLEPQDLEQFERLCQKLE